MTQEELANLQTLVADITSEVNNPGLRVHIWTITKHMANYFDIRTFGVSLRKLRNGRCVVWPYDIANEEFVGNGEEVSANQVVSKMREQAPYDIQAEGVTSWSREPDQDVLLPLVDLPGPHHVVREEDFSDIDPVLMTSVPLQQAVYIGPDAMQRGITEIFAYDNLKHIMEFDWRSPTTRRPFSGTDVYRFHDATATKRAAREVASILRGMVSKRRRRR